MLYDKFSQLFGLDSMDIASTTCRSPEQLEFTRAEKAMQAIKHYILKNSLQPGDLLPTEAQLCNELGVSRTAVREALRRLEALDIVCSQRGRGTFVARMTLRPLVESLLLRSATDSENNKLRLHEVVLIRRAIDLGNAGDLCKAGQEADLSFAFALVDQMVAAAEQGQTFMEQDIAFHSCLLELLANPLLVQLNQALWLVHMAIVPHLENVEPAGLLETAKAHGRMLAAIQAADETAYKQAVIEHYKPLLNRVNMP